MNLQEAAAWEIHSFLTSIGMRYAIIGGMAVQWWGEPRLTKDVDLTVAAPLDDPESFIRQVADAFAPRIEDAVAFARRNRIILVQASNGCPLDISMGLPGYEEEVMERAVEIELEPGKEVRLCSAEDLIIHKAVAGRPQDVRDIEGIVYRQRDRLDISTIRRWLQIFADLLDNSDVRDHFERPWRRINTSQRLG